MERDLISTRYEVSEKGDRFHVFAVTGGMGWGIGYSFNERENAEAAARMLNGLVALDEGVFRLK